jgi:hypothetical protein
MARRRGFETLGDWLRTLAVFAVIVAVGYLIVPHSHRDEPVSVAYRQPARYFAQQASFTVLLPSSLPAGWYANHVRTIDAGTPRDGLDLGFYDDPDHSYVALEESAAPRRVFLRQQGVTGRPRGGLEVAGRHYQVWPDTTGPSGTALVGALSGGATVVLGGGAPLPVLLEVAERLVPSR